MKLTINPAYRLYAFNRTIKINKINPKYALYELAVNQNEPFEFDVHNILCNDRKKLKEIALIKKKELIERLKKELEEAEKLNFR